MVASYVYEAYGEIYSATGTMAQINPIRYKQYYYDTETGFYYLMSRYYDPVIARFINADGLASTGQGITGYNMFAYCNNSPVECMDSEGTRPIASTTTGEESDFDRAYSMAYMRYKDASVEFLTQRAIASVERKSPKHSSGVLAKDECTDLGYGVTRSVTAIYVSEEDAQAFYTLWLEDSAKTTIIDDIALLGGIGLSACSHPIIGAALIAYDLIDWFNGKVNQLYLHKYKGAMSEGTGVLIVETTVSGPRVVANTFVEFYSWDGRGDFHAYIN